MATDMTTQKFSQWLALARPGERFEYHRGRSLENAPPGLASQALAASEGRLVLLMCRRYSVGDSGYLAVRVSGECPDWIFPRLERKTTGTGLHVRRARVES
jgi:hypothetical protein